MKITRYINFAQKIAFDIKAALFGSNEFPYDERSEDSSAYAINYEFALKNKHKFYPDLDENGIPIANYLNSGFQYNPTRIASYALANYNRAKFNSDREAEKIFLRVADWFLNQKDKLFYYNYNYESLKSPWISCMAQGQGISVLCRAFLLTNEQQYLQAAIEATKPFKISINESGLLSNIDEKWPILEEFPFENNTWHVLNGFLYAIIGLKELLDIEKEAFSTSDFAKLLETAQKGEFWTYNNWTTYDLQAYNSEIRNTATVNYHRVHIAQYKYLASKFPDLAFNRWAIKWENNYNSFGKRLVALKNKILFRLKNPATRF